MHTSLLPGAFEGPEFTPGSLWRASILLLLTGE